MKDKHQKYLAVVWKGLEEWERGVNDAQMVATQRSDWWYHYQDGGEKGDEILEKKLILS